MAPSGFGGSGAYTVHWTVRDQANGRVVYQSPGSGESRLSLSLSASLLEDVKPDLCLDDHIRSVEVSVTVSRAHLSSGGSGSAEASWDGGRPPNEKLCELDGPEDDGPGRGHEPPR